MRLCRFAHARPLRLFLLPAHLRSRLIAGNLRHPTPMHSWLMTVARPPSPPLVASRDVIAVVRLVVSSDLRCWRPSQPEKRIHDGPCDREHTAKDYEPMPYAMLVSAPARSPCGPAHVEIGIGCDRTLNEWLRFVHLYSYRSYAGAHRWRQTINYYRQ
jgi:hypothetical protein